MLSLYVRMMTRAQGASEKGAVASEYAVLLAMIAAAMVTAVIGLRDVIINVIDGAATELN